MAAPIQVGAVHRDVNAGYSGAGRPVRASGDGWHPPVNCNLLDSPFPCGPNGKCCEMDLESCMSNNCYPL
jgi:hypothetical protein